MAYSRWYDSADEFHEDMERQLDRFDHDLDFDPRFALVCPDCGTRNQMPQELVSSLLPDQPFHGKRPPRPAYRIRARLRCVQCQGNGHFTTEPVRTRLDGESAYGWPALAPVMGAQSHYQGAPTYHRISCPEADLIPDDMIVAFLDRNVARARGYSPCAQCRP